MKKAGKSTPVTEETFMAWMEEKKRRRAAEAKRKVEAEFKKKKGGKGLSVLSGRDLYEYKRDLFDKTEDDDEDNDFKFSKQSSTVDETVDEVADQVQKDLFLQGDDDDLDDLDDD